MHWHFIGQTHCNIHGTQLHVHFICDYYPLATDSPVNLRWKWPNLEQIATEGFFALTGQLDLAEHYIKSFPKVTPLRTLICIFSPKNGQKHMILGISSAFFCFWELNLQCWHVCTTYVVWHCYEKIISENVS